MANLRLIIIKAIDSTTIKARFNQNLDPLINVANIAITTSAIGVPNPRVLSVAISEANLTITTQPMTPYVEYFVEFKSTDTFSFKSKDGSFFLFEDGVTNKPSILGPEDPANPIRETLLSYLKDNVYNLENGSLVRSVINSQSDLLAKALYHIREAKNDNYVSVIIENEKKIRGSGPYDRLNEEGAYEIIRVGKNSFGAALSTSLSFSAFPSDPVTLLTTVVSSEQLTANNTGVSSFNGLILTVAKNYVIKLTGVTIAYQNGSTAVYDIGVYGYQIKEPRYDADRASPLQTLSDNQFKLSENILENGFIPPAVGDTVIVSYEYQQKGRIIDENSVVVSQVLDATRESVPPILTQFTLAHYPIVSANDIQVTSAGVQFLDPNAVPPFSATHPAFEKEIPFKFDGLPSQPGEYCVDYATGRVYCWGVDTNDGSGDFPPVATYKYRYSFAPRLDYTYDPTTYELAANPLRSLAGQNAKISFNYEQALVPDIDFKAQVHNEILDERIENKLTSTGTLLVNHTPITNVFRVFNETSGEIYRVSRWSDNKVYFTSTNTPRILDEIRERVSFTNVINELLISSSEFVNSLGTRVLKINLSNNRIISASEDSIGSSFNSSVQFSRADIFQNELYFDSQILTVTVNTDRLTVGKYQIDYVNGVVYVGVALSQNFDLGTVNYKKPVINPVNPHIISVSELYNSLSNAAGVTRRLDYVSVSEASVVPSSFDLSDERFLNGDQTLQYIVSNNSINVSHDVKEVRGVYDFEDLTSNSSPTNFADGATVSGTTISLDTSGISKQEILEIDSGNIINATFISNGAEIVSVTSIIRNSDGADLWSTPGSFSNYTITLSGVGSPVVGELVTVIYNVALKGSATPVVDYNRGDYYMDYTYLADEIIVSYEYGDNNIDFRESSALDEGETYYVTYKVGALRNALLENFGSLINIPIMNFLDTTFPRERYRDAVKAALQSFTKGPTIPAMKAIVSNITHIDPELIESVFENWSLGVSYLHPSKIRTTGNLQLVSGKFDLGARIFEEDQTISFPISSNLRLEEGTLETWVIPDWDGLDNDATLTFSEILLDGYSLPSNKIWIGADSHHPTYSKTNSFTVNRQDDNSPIGLPSAIYTQTGMFIFYDVTSKRWRVYVKDSVLGAGHIYSGMVTSSGEVYDVKFIPGLGELNDTLTSFQNSIKFTFNIDNNDLSSPDGYVDGYNVLDGYYPGDGYVDGYSYDGIHFMADDEHYLFDFGKDSSTSRFSLFKDGKGYLNFRIFDRGDSYQHGQKSQYKVSADISNWLAGEKHHVAVAWRINSSDKRDEMHLFIDGVEVPNIMRFGGRPVAAATDRFRTVKPEFVAGTVPKKSITGRDLNTTNGSALVVSDSINFQNENIVAGDTIQILETGFTTYNILSVSGHTLVLDGNAPTTLADARFTVNKYSVVVSSNIDLYSNIVVSVLRDGEEEELPGLRATTPAYAISKNAFNENVLTILGNAEVGDQIVIRTLGLNHRRSRDRQFIWGNTSNVLRTNLPPPINLDEAKIISVPLPLTTVGPDNSVYSLGQFTATLTPTQPTNSVDGRTLSLRVTGGNVTFPVTVTINGTSTGPGSEVLVFNSPGIKDTVNKWKTLTSVVVVATPVFSTQDACSVEAKEKYQITYPDGNSDYPVIRFSYKTQRGTSLEGTAGSGTLIDNDGAFFESNVGQKLVINTPLSVAGTYTITNRIGNNTITVTPVVSNNFTGGNYDVYNISIGRSGFQNGFFYLEEAGSTNVPFTLPQGVYEFDYSSYLEIPFHSVTNMRGFVGSDMFGQKQAKAILDEFRILNKRLTDVRVGETLAVNQESITTDYTALRQFEANSNTLMLLHFNEEPLKNSADVWISSEKTYLQSGNSVNANFGQSLVITDRPLVVENTGLLSTASEGSIEFWVSPRYDTANDPNFRFYFDASSAIVEEVTSVSSGVVKVTGRVSQVLSVRLATDSGNNGYDYFAGGSLASDFQTINLKRALPYQQTPVKVQYIPSGLIGDRLSIYKDPQGFINFNVRAAGVDYQVRQPVFWARDSWHRIRATYKFNRSDNKDEIRLFIDGEERGVVLFGSGLLFGEGAIFGQGFAGVTNAVFKADINFRDPINQFFIGSDYLRANPCQARIDNLKISNTAQKPVLVSGQPKDVNYSSNLSLVYPVVPDVFTTYLLNFDSLLKKADDFALLRNERFGIFDFTLDIIDSFGIVSSNAKVKQILETLIRALKPAQSRVTINYVS